MTLRKSNNKNKEILIFVTNIFLTGVDFNLINGIIYSTQNIIKEIEVCAQHTVVVYGNEPVD